MYIRKSYDINVQCTYFYHNDKEIFCLPDEDLHLYVDTSNPDYSYTEATRIVETGLAAMLDFDAK